MNEWIIHKLWSKLSAIEQTSPPPPQKKKKRQGKIKRKKYSFPNNMADFMPQLFNIYFIPATRDYHQHMHLQHSTSNFMILNQKGLRLEKVYICFYPCGPPR
jgi:hypothetical protein